ncbi:MAG: H-NS histone family protein [Burkholderiaceae bacterium]
MATLLELVAQKEQLEREIESTRKSERDAAIAQVRSLMGEYGLSLSDLGTKSAAAKTGGRKAGATKGSKVPAKYRDASNGDTWSGRGLQPKWLKAAMQSGKTLQDFAI